MPSITIVAPHLRHRILARRSVTFSSAIEYLAWHAGQEIFTISLADALSGLGEGRESFALSGLGSASLIKGYAPVQFSVSAGAERATLLSFLGKIARPHAGVPTFDPAQEGYLWCRNIPRCGSEGSPAELVETQAPMANRAKSRASRRSASSSFSPSSRSASCNSRFAPLRSPAEISSSARSA